MRPPLILVTSALLLGVLVLREVTGQDKDAGRVTDEAAIRKILADYVGAWNRHDMTAWGKLFTDDVDYVNRGGGWWRSNKENVEGHKLIHDMLVRQKQKMTYKSDVEKITFLKPDIAVVHVTWEWPGFTLPSGEEVTDFRGIITMVTVKLDGKWLIRALQNTVTSMRPAAKQSEDARTISGSRFDAAG
jgi:uncharacterized protein (TIGR02246 family)